MRNNEILLFKALCKFKEDAFDESLLAYATPWVLGQLFYNRMAGVAYDTLKRHRLLGKVNREFRNALQMAYDHNTEKNNSFFDCVDQVSRILEKCNCAVAMLKGAWLCAHYPSGYRISSDIDLLVLSRDVSEVGDLLNDAGFSQGYVRNGEFIPASRREIIESKMMRGETVPYIKKVSLPNMPYLEVDINFSLDYKNGEDGLLTDMLKRVELKKEKAVAVPSLRKEDFFIHLCAHLYKEATTLPWVMMHRDMTLYKYADIYLLLNEMTDQETTNVFSYAQQLGLDKICAYAVVQTCDLFDMTGSVAYQKAIAILDADHEFLYKVIAPSEKKEYLYQTHDTVERFFMDDRMSDLKEVEKNAKVEYA